MNWSWTYPLSQTVNGQVACDQIEQEIAMSSISVPLVEGPNGVACTFTMCTFRFQSDLTQEEETTLSQIVSDHTGEGLPSSNEFQNVEPEDLPSTAENGDAFYASSGSLGPGPVYWDGAHWVYFSNNGSVT